MEQAFARQTHEVNLVCAVRKSRVEVSHKTALVLYRNLPDAEESEYMVNTESVEVLAHLAQAALPPGVVILGHLVPVVGREAPVLAVCGEIIRRSAGA